MTPDEALQFINNVVAQVSTNREGHLKISQAMQVLAKAIEPKKSKGKAPKPPD